MVFELGLINILHCNINMHCLAKMGGQSNSDDFPFLRYHFYLILGLFRFFELFLAKMDALDPDIWVRTN